MRFASLRTIALAVSALALSTPASADLKAALANANAGKGDRVVKKCVSCRTFGWLDAFLTKPNKEMNSFSDAPLVFKATDTAAPPSDDDEEYEFGVLFDAPGVEATYYTCAGCHSEMIVAQQGLNRDEWEELLEWMVEEQGMSEIEEPELTEILDYLAAHYNEDRPNFPRPLNQ